MHRYRLVVGVLLAALTLCACGDDSASEGAAPAGSLVTLDGLRYEVPLSRQLNPSLRPDGELFSRRDLADGHIWFGVFLRVCNAHGDRAVPAESLALLTTPYDRVARPQELRAGNPFAYEPREIAVNSCLPPPGSVAAQVVAGSLALFEIPSGWLERRPLVLRLQDGGEERRIELDI